MTSTAKDLSSGRQALDGGVEEASRDEPVVCRNGPKAEGWTGQVEDLEPKR